MYPDIFFLFTFYCCFYMQQVEGFGMDLHKKAAELADTLLPKLEIRIEGVLPLGELHVSQDLLHRQLMKGS